MSLKHIMSLKHTKDYIFETSKTLSLKHAKHYAFETYKHYVYKKCFYVWDGEIM